MSERKLKQRLKIAITGSSITWGNGLMDDSYSYYVDEYIRNELADTILHKDMAYSGSKEELFNDKLYKKSAAKIFGGNSSVSFELDGDELSVCMAMERENKGACEIELYVDGVLYDSFTNENPYATQVQKKVFRCDGVKNLFDLEACHTFNHEACLNGARLKGITYSGGYGGKFDDSCDYMVVRKYFRDRNGEVKVNHALWFQNPPQNGYILEVRFQYGENILYTKTSYGEIEEKINSKCESTYGCDQLGDVFECEDISWGLDFRYTDNRSIKTWEFDSCKKRKFTFRIKKPLDEYIPYFIINFATNRFHSFMNAGIGGWTANKLLTHYGLNHYKEIIQFNPDILLIEEGTNDDWDFARFSAVKSYRNISKEQYLKIPTIWIKESEWKHHHFDIQSSVLSIADITSDSVVFDGKDVECEDVKNGDVVILGNCRGDNRTTVFRKIDSWNPETKTAYFSCPIAQGDFYGITDLSDLIGREARIKNFDLYEGQLNRLIDLFRENNEKIKIGLIGTGLSNFYLRLLMGYDIKLKEIALKRDCYFADVYPEIMKWQYDLPRDIVCNPVKQPDNSYLLVNEAGEDINKSMGLCGIRNFNVRVNGQDYSEKGYCYIEGGYGSFFDEKYHAEELEIKNYKNKNSDWIYVPTRLVFVKEEPKENDVIHVTASSQKWSNDDCHLSESPYGAQIYAKVVNNRLLNIIEDMSAEGK